MQNNLEQPLNFIAPCLRNETCNTFCRWYRGRIEPDHSHMWLLCAVGNYNIFLGKGGGAGTASDRPRPLPYEAPLDCHSSHKRTIQEGTENRPREKTGAARV